MIRSLAKFSGLTAFAAIAATASAEVKLNDYLSIDGYATAAARVTEGTTTSSGFTNGSNQVQIENNGRTDNSAKLALNGKYQDLSVKVSGLLRNGDNYETGNTNDGGHNFGLLDAYATYKTGDLAITGGKFCSVLGYESFDSPNNAFISPSMIFVTANYGTGVKTEYTTKDYSTGVSVRDSNDGALYTPGDKMYGSFYQGDNNFGNGLGYEAYFLYKGIEKIQIFVGAGFQNPYSSYGSIPTYDFWVSYAITDKLMLVLELASNSDSDVSLGANRIVASRPDLRHYYCSNFIASYALSDALSVSGRVGGYETDRNRTGSSESYFHGFNYGLASNYRFTKNFSLKAEVVKFEYYSHFNSTTEEADNNFSYALQAVVQF